MYRQNFERDSKRGNGRVNGRVRRLGAIINEESSASQHTFSRIGTIMGLALVWKDIAGDKIAQMSSPYRLNNGILHVAVKDSIWLAELPYLKGEMMKRFAEHGVKLEDIRFALSPVRAEAPKAEDILRSLDEGEQQRVARMGAVISDDGVRSAFTRAYAMYLRRHGGK